MSNFIELHMKWARGITPIYINMDKVIEMYEHVDEKTGVNTVLVESFSYHHGDTNLECRVKETIEEIKGLMGERHWALPPKEKDE